MGFNCKRIRIAPFSLMQCNSVGFECECLIGVIFESEVK